jgi:hypothetical protein
MTASGMSCPLLVGSGASDVYLRRRRLTNWR